MKILERNKENKIEKEKKEKQIERKRKNKGGYSNSHINEYCVNEKIS